jgi:hypothetical protein
MGLPDAWPRTSAGLKPILFRPSAVVRYLNAPENLIEIELLLRSNLSLLKCVKARATGNLTSEAMRAIPE